MKAVLATLGLPLLLIVVTGISADENFQESEFFAAEEGDDLVREVRQGPVALAAAPGGFPGGAGATPFAAIGGFPGGGGASPYASIGGFPGGIGPYPPFFPPPDPCRPPSYYCPRCSSIMPWDSQQCMQFCLNNRFCFCTW